MEALIGAILLVGVVCGWVARSFFPAYLSAKGKNLATKEDIGEITDKIESVRSQYTTDTERLRAELRAAAHERETKFSKLHERRADAIDGLYRRMVKTHLAFFPLTGGIVSAEGDTSDALLEKARIAGNDLLEFFAENRLYLDRALIGEFGVIQKRLSDAWVTFALDRRDDSLRAPRSERERRVDAWHKARDLIRDEVPRLLEQIEDRMRVALGETGRQEEGDGYSSSAKGAGKTKQPGEASASADRDERDPPDWYGKG